MKHRHIRNKVVDYSTRYPYNIINTKYVMLIILYSNTVSAHARRLERRRYAPDPYAVRIRPSLFMLWAGSSVANRFVATVATIFLNRTSGPRLYFRHFPGLGKSLSEIPPTIYSTRDPRAFSDACIFVRVHVPYLGTARDVLH